MRKIIFLPLFLFMLLAAGCWDRREIDNLAIVGAIGFDKVTVDDRDMYLTTVQIYKPGEMGGGLEGGGVKTIAPYWVVSASGKTLYDAEKNISSRSPRSMFLPHSDVVIIGERLAKEDGIDKVMDLLLRNKDLRLRSSLYVTEGEAREVFEKGLPQLESTLSQELKGIKEKSLPDVSKGYAPDVNEFAHCLLTDGRDPVAGKLAIFKVPEKLPPPTSWEKPQSYARPAGMAVFRGSKLAGWLTENETQGFLYVVNKAKEGIIPLKLPDSQQEVFSFQMTGSKAKIIPSVRGDNVSIKLEIKAEGNIGDIEDSLSVSDPEDIKKLESLAADSIKELIENTVHRTQAMEADVFGFGEIINRKHPKLWKDMKEDWQYIYSDLTVKVKVEVKIRGTGMISNPITVESR